MKDKDNFESKLERLEQLTADIKRSDISLEEAIKDFEEGIKLAKGMEKVLNEIEGKVEILMNTPDEDKAEKSDDDSSDDESDDESDDDSSDDDEESNKIEDEEEFQKTVNFDTMEMVDESLADKAIKRHAAIEKKSSKATKKKSTELLFDLFEDSGEVNGTRK